MPGGCYSSYPPAPKRAVVGRPSRNRKRNRAARQARRRNR